jgi:hypothetical protein
MTITNSFYLLTDTMSLSTTKSPTSWRNFIDHGSRFYLPQNTTLGLALLVARSKLDFVIYGKFKIKTPLISFPDVESGKRCLNSGLFIGYASRLYDLLKNTRFPVDNDQKYYSHLYLDEKIRREFNIGLDHRCEIFQTFEGDLNHVDLLYRGEYDIL